MAFLPRALNVKRRYPAPPRKKPRVFHPEYDTKISVNSCTDFPDVKGSNLEVENIKTTPEDTTGMSVDATSTPFSPFDSSTDREEDEIQKNCSDEDSGDDDESVLSFSKDQRKALPGDPICVVCGRYGAYICDLTGDDVCSLECKARILKVKGHHLGDLQREQICVMDNQQPLASIASNLTPVQADLLRNEMKIKVKGEAIPLPIVDFNQFITEKTLLMNLTESLGITVPTPVQMQAIPCVYLQRDVLICANTGSGKTLSFLLPIIKLISIHQSVYPVAVILAPVRELCIQIEEVAKFLMRGVPNMRTALVVGGLPIANQIHRLKQQVQIVIATPARLLDVIRNHNSVIDLSKIHVMILDEADSLLELGFEPQVHELLQSIPMKRQIVLASATIPKRIEDLAKDLLHAPITVTVGEPTLPAEGIRHIVLWESETLKKKRLFTILRDSKLFDPPVVVFVTSRVATLLLAEAIDKTLDIPTMAVHGDMPQDRRMKILQDFKDQKYSILVATGGLVGRGLDLPLCKQVIVFDFPSSIHDYIHQIGRCARLGSVGRAITFINDTNKKSFLKLVKLLEPMGVQLPPELTHSPHLRDQMGRQHRAKLTQSHEKDTCSRETLMAMIQGKEQDKKK